MLKPSSASERKHEDLGTRLALADLAHTAGNEGCCQMIVGQEWHWCMLGTLGFAQPT